ncbi:MAG: immunoglobulin domain-containing protein, partial [Limisphaerales bacterium]
MALRPQIFRLIALLVCLVFNTMANPGGLDVVFNSGSGADGNVQAIVVQPDGKLLIAGAFGSYNGAVRNRIARLLPDGTLDPGFNHLTGVDGTVYGMARQADGKVVIGGNFYGLNGSNNRSIGRLDADGSPDISGNWGSNGVKTDGTVNAITVQADGKIVIAGTFGMVNGIVRNRVARLNVDGTVDLGFDPGGGPGGTVLALAVQPDGRILVGGQFSLFNGVTHNPVARLNSNGALDTSFDSGPLISGYVASINVLPGGSVLLGGGISAGSRSRMVQLTSGGALDATFNAGSTINSDVIAVAVQGDGKLIIGGYFSTIAGVSRPGIARLNADGSLDASFDPGTGLNDLPYSIVLDDSGNVVVGGKFTRAGGQVRNHIARFDNLSGPSITAQPQSLLVTAGANAAFSVTAVGAPTLAYQWRFNGADLLGENGATLTLTNAQPPQAGDYTVVVTNAVGSVTSSVAVLTFGTAPVITL